MSSRGLGRVERLRPRFASAPMRRLMVSAGASGLSKSIVSAVAEGVAWCSGTHM